MGPSRRSGNARKGGGYGQAIRLILSGEPIDAEVTHRIGLVEFLANDAVLLDQARAFCKKLASYSPAAVEAATAAVRIALNAPLTTGLAYENEMNTLCLAARDHVEGARALMEKRVRQLRLGAPLKTETSRSNNGRPTRVSRSRLIHRRKLVCELR